MEELIILKPEKYSKLLKTWRVVKLTTLNWCTGQVIISILTLLDFDRYVVFISSLQMEILALVLQI